MEPNVLLSTKITRLSNLLSTLVSEHGDTFSQCAKIIGDTLKNEKTIFGAAMVVALQKVLT